MLHYLHRFPRAFRAVFLAMLAILLVVVACQPPQQLQQPNQQPNRVHNMVVFVTDGLRPTAVNATDTPTLEAIRQQGVNFVNSHSLFPTFTTANASEIATGHYLGDTGDFSNTINVGFPVQSANSSPVPFLENNAVLRQINAKFGQNFLNEQSLLAVAREAGLSTAAVGKVGPTLIQDVTQQNGNATLIVDDATGSETEIALSAEFKTLLQQNNLPLSAPSRGANGKPGNSTEPGTKVPNTEQQQYFADVTTKVILPLFKQRQKPFVLVYWSRDPDGTQHNQGDSLNALTPGIDGPTAKAARQNMDRNLAQIRTALKDLGLEATTNLFVTADHGFSTISKQSKLSYAASLPYPDVPAGFLPPGFLAIDLAQGLKQTLTDPDKQNATVDPKRGKFSKNGFLRQLPTKPPTVVVAANGGSDLIYLPEASDLKALAAKIVEFLLQQDYVSGLFVNDALGQPPGSLPFSAINLRGSARTPTPAVVVNFKSFDTGCGTPTACGAEVADTPLQQGQGMHGSFSRADTFNLMTAIGPDFKQGFVDQAPVGNADVPLTLANLLHLQLSTKGKLVGRVLSEALVNGPATVATKAEIRQSKPAPNGLQTILKYQTVGQTRYFDAAGFKGRTIGL